MQQCRSPGLIVFTSVSCDCLCYLRAPCQFSSSPGFHITHIPKANLVYIFWFVLHSSYSYHTYKFIFSFWFSGARNMEMYLVICAHTIRVGMSNLAGTVPLRARAGLHAHAYFCRTFVSFHRGFFSLSFGYHKLQHNDVQYFRPMSYYENITNIISINSIAVVQQ